MCFRQQTYITVIEILNSCQEKKKYSQGERTNIATSTSESLGNLHPWRYLMLNCDLKLKQNIVIQFGGWPWSEWEVGSDDFQKPLASSATKKIYNFQKFYQQTTRCFSPFLVFLLLTNLDFLIQTVFLLISSFLFDEIINFCSKKKSSRILIILQVY